MKRQVQLFVSREENTSPRYLSCRSNVLTALETRPNESSESIKKLKLHFDDAFSKKDTNISYQKRRIIYCRAISGIKLQFSP